MGMKTVLLGCGPYGVITRLFAGAMTFVFLAGVSLAQSVASAPAEPALPAHATKLALDSGDTSWMLMSSIRIEFSATDANQFPTSAVETEKSLVCTGDPVEFS